MARININLGTPPTGNDGDPVRTAFEKVNTMTTELYGGIDVANASGWGRATPRVFQPSDSANNLPPVSGIFLFNNGGLDLPYPYVFIEQMTSGGGFVVQRAYAINTTGSWIRRYVAGEAGTSQWVKMLDTNFTNLSVEDGGIVSRTIVSGLVVTKFSSGLQLTSGQFGSTSQIAANAFTALSLTLPVNTGPDTGRTTISVLAAPTNTNDFYGITSAYMNSPTVLGLVVRNGGTAQAFGIKGTIIGQWK